MTAFEIELSRLAENRVDREILIQYASEIAELCEQWLREDRPEIFVEAGE